MDFDALNQNVRNSIETNAELSRAKGAENFAFWNAIDRFIGPKAGAIPRDLRKARAIVIACLIGLVFAIVGLTYDVLLYPEPNLLKVLGWPVIALALFTPFLIRWYGNPQFFGNFAVGLFYLSVTAIATIENGILDYSVYLLFLVPIWASLMSTVRACIVFTILTALSFILVSASAQFGFAQTMSYPDNWHYLSYGFVAALVAVTIGATSVAGHLLLQQSSRDLQSALMNAKTVNEQKSQFIATTSHEIRTPLTNLIGMLDLIQKEDLSPGSADKIDSAKGAAKNLLSLVTDLLDLARMDVGEFRLRAEPIDVVDLFRDTSEAFRASVELKDLELIVNTPASPAWISADPVRLRQILVNYLGNAVKFTEHGRIEADLIVQPIKDQSKLVCFRISDTGRGISAPAQNAVFERFVQSGQDVGASALATVGTGLGLSIVKDLADLMNGQVGVASELGHGSIFWFEAEFESSQPLQQKSTASPKPLTSKPLRILVVDDNSGNQKVLTEVLAAFGHTTTVAPNGRDAIDQLVRDDAFDLILMDLHMPVMDGAEAIMRIRGMDTHHASIPIIAVSADDGDDDKARCLALGASAFVSKPIDFAELGIAIRQLEV